MASQQQVKAYLAHWFQLGKQVVFSKNHTQILPQPIFERGHYSSAFERCWQQMLQPDSGDCYLEGSQATVQQLLGPAWELLPCARCDMPVPSINWGIQEPNCPCSDLTLWPNRELPQPRSVVDTQAQLDNIRARLLREAEQ